MGSVFMAQFAKDRRNPLLVLLFIALSIGATLLFGGGFQRASTVAIFSDEPGGEAIVAGWAERLNGRSAPFRFQTMDGETARERVGEGRLDVAVRLMADDYRLIAASDSPMIQLVDQHVRSVFVRELHIRALSSSGDADALRAEVDAWMDQPLFRIIRQGTDGEERRGYNMGVQLLFAFTLLLAMFTAGFKLNGIANDKVSGIWDRLILSPVRKTGMYAGYLAYSFCATLLQIVIVLLICQYGIGYDLGPSFGLLIVISAVFSFSMVSMATLIAGFMAKPEQFYALYPSFISLVPLVSGAYMMPGSMGHPVFRFIADLFPMSHAMDAFMLVANDYAGMPDIALPLSIMLLIGVIYMGVGVQLVERRSV